MVTNGSSTFRWRRGRRPPGNRSDCGTLAATRGRQRTCRRSFLHAPPTASSSSRDGCWDRKTGGRGRPRELLRESTWMMRLASSFGTSGTSGMTAEGKLMTPDRAVPENPVQERPAAPEGKGLVSDWRFQLAVVVLVALVPRMIFLWQIKSWPFFSYSGLDFG